MHLAYKTGKIDTIQRHGEKGTAEMSKTVLITGASMGIGAAAARYMAGQGWTVAVHYNSHAQQAQALVREIGGVALGADVSDPDQAAQLVADAEEKLGCLDALVCSAGIALPQQLLTDTTTDQWRRVMGVDLDGVFHVVRAAIPGMVRRKTGSIVTISSMWGVTGGSCEVPYSAAKAGVIGLTQALAKELGPSGVRVNCVAPGVIATEMNGHLTQEDLAALEEETPLGRIGKPEEVAAAIAFLAGESSSFVTGQVLRVDGGMAI